MILTTGSLFSGICSEHWALSPLVKTKQVFAADNNKFACQFIRQNVRPDMLIEEDLTHYNVQSLPYVDVFLAGVPCQSFSSIGNHTPDDVRNNLYKIPLKYARAKKPKYFIFENVPQFQKSEFFPRLVCALKRIYTFVESSIQTSSEYGSIQRRKRLFVVGSNVPFRLPRGRERSPPLDIACFVYLSSNLIGDMGPCYSSFVLPCLDLILTIIMLSPFYRCFPCYSDVYSRK